MVPLMDTTTTQRVAANIRAELARRKLGGVDLARVLGMSQAAASRRLTGEVPFGINEVAVTADWLGVDMVALFSESPAA